MEDWLMILVVILFFVIGSIVLKRVETENHEFWIDHNILVVHNGNIDENIYDFANSTTSIDDEMIYRYDYIFVCLMNDFQNLITIYNIKKNNQKCEIYSVFHDYEMKNLYLKENVKLFDAKDLHKLVKKIYEQNH
ncbi:MAG: hypothetical protein U0L85_04350 [Bacilli bacterium]|nr:hypothetical protein [Bacilli bacterium]